MQWHATWFKDIIKFFSFQCRKKRYAQEILCDNVSMLFPCFVNKCKNKVLYCHVFPLFRKMPLAKKCVHWLPDRAVLPVYWRQFSVWQRFILCCGFVRCADASCHESLLLFQRVVFFSWLNLSVRSCLISVCIKTQSSYRKYMDCLQRLGRVSYSTNNDNWTI